MVAKFEEYFPEKSLKCGELLSFPKHHYQVEEILFKNAKTGLEENATVFTRATSGHEEVQLLVLDSKSNGLGRVTLKEKVYEIEGNKISYLNIDLFKLFIPLFKGAKQTDYQNLYCYIFYKIKEFAFNLGFDGRVSANPVYRDTFYSHGFRFLSCSLEELGEAWGEPSKEKCRELDEIVRKEIEGTYDREKEDPECENYDLSVRLPLYYAEVSEQVTKWGFRKGPEVKSARNV